MRTKKNNVLFTVLRALYWVQLLLGLTTVCLFVSLAYIIIFLCAHRVTQPKNTLIIYQATREWLAMSVSVSCVEGKLPRFFAESSCHGAKYIAKLHPPPPSPTATPKAPPLCIELRGCSGAGFDSGWSYDDAHLVYIYRLGSFEIL